jgi:hypothetical protein
VFDETKHTKLSLYLLGDYRLNPGSLNFSKTTSAAFFTQDFRFDFLRTLDYTSKRLRWSRFFPFFHPEASWRGSDIPPAAVVWFCRDITILSSRYYLCELRRKLAFDGDFFEGGRE